MATRASLPQGRFLVRPRPGSDEHPVSFLLRLGEANGYIGRTAICGFVKSLVRSMQSESGLESVAYSADLDPYQLKEMLYRPQRIPDVAERPGRFARRYFFRDRYSVFCPTCVRERRFFRSIWNFRAVAACETHGLWLVDRCPHCACLISWERRGALACTCGFELGRAEAKQAPMEVVLVTKLLVAALVIESESDLLAPSPFCEELTKMTALEWLALFSYLASTSLGSQSFHPFCNDHLKVEKDAVRIAARIFLDWPESVFKELCTCWGQVELLGLEPPVTSVRHLRSRAPVGHAFRLSGPMQLPRFMRDTIEAYVSALTVHSQGVGLAVNPDCLVFSGDGVPTIRSGKSDDSQGITIESRNACAILTLPNRVEELRRANIVLHDFGSIERLIRATPYQRRLLMHCGFLQPLEGRMLVLSSEVDKLRAWIERTAGTITFSPSLVPLSSLSPSRGKLLLHVIVAIQGRTMSLFRSLGDEIRLDKCFVAERSLSGFPS
ncbi:TniQ family protein [Paraburkholderia aspalathi]|uniref:TniQ family protein n=1 Tax=Paraburkholderia aspalathi TaxID=1324617 RepID=UPI0038BB9EA5